MAGVKSFGDRLNEIIVFGEKTLTSRTHAPLIDHKMFLGFQAASLSFILNVYGVDHPYYKSFMHNVRGVSMHYIESALGILEAIKSEFDGGWLTTMDGLISADLFSDFLEMAEHLLSQKYKDAAAVITGSVLEEHLRKLCKKHGIAAEDIDSTTGRTFPKKAETLNTQLAGSSIYTKSDQKNVTAWLDLRNKAAHGKYTEYTHSQVELLLQGIRDFITRNYI